MPGTLYLVGTPIGNLGDFSPRAVETMRSVDFIAAEDTRVTLKLMNHFDIHRPLISYYEHNQNAALSCLACLRERAAFWSRTPVCPRSPIPVRSWCGSARRQASPSRPYRDPAR